MSSRSNNKRKERRKEAAFAGNGSLAVLFILASILIAGSSFAFIGFTTAPMTTTAAVVYAQEGDNNTADSTASNATSTTTTMTTNSSSGIELSSQPILQERTTTTSQTPINQTHISATFTGNGTLTIPNTNANAAINFTTNGTALISLITHSTQAKATIMTEQGETATATFYEILRIDPAAAGDGRGLTMALIETDSAGMLAPLNGTIVAGISDLQSNEANTVTLWEWESGIDNNASDGATSAQ
jgi:cytoskeletal protein RodZ